MGSVKSLKSGSPTSAAVIRFDSQVIGIEFHFMSSVHLFQPDGQPKWLACQLYDRRQVVQMSFNDINSVK